MTDKEIPLSQHCQVLKVISECKEPVDVHYLRKQLKNELTNQQVSSALTWLVKIGKVEKLSQVQGNQNQCNQYMFNDDFDRDNKAMKRLDIKPLREVQKRRKKTRTGNLSRAYQERAKTTLVPGLKFREQKLKLLARLERFVSSNEKDLFLGIINDYKS